jgi:hypothetical protein
MSQHDQRTQQGPSVARIVIGGLAAIGVVWAVLWIASGPEFDSRHLGGLVLGMVLFAGLASSVAAMVLERHAAIERQRRRMYAERAAQEEELARRAAATGTWRAVIGGQSLTVRYDEAAAAWWVQGWLGQFWSLGAETEWTWSTDSLRSTIRELEETGEIVPLAGQGTAAVRARLGLKDRETVSSPVMAAGLDWAEPISSSPLRTAVLPMPLARPTDDTQWFGERPEE